MPKRERSIEVDDALNLTPMIDCVFLPLIFFMVTTVFKQPYTLVVELPEARQAQVVEEKKLVASISADGRMEINRVPVDLSTIDEILRREQQGTRSLTLVVRTDKETRHKHLLDLFEAAKRAGIEKIPLATEDLKAEE